MGASMVSNRIIREWNAELMKKKVEPETVQTDFSKEISLALYSAACAAHGNNIFCFDSTLGEMLENTSASDIPLSALKSPYGAYYIQFHRPVMWGKRGIIGAYVIDDDRTHYLQVCLVLEPSSPSEHWMRSPSDYFALLMDKNAEGGLGEVIDQTIEKDIIAKWDLVAPHDILSEYGVKDVREARAKRESGDLSSAREAIHKAMEYMANCLCYLSAYRPSETAYNVDAPTALTEKVLHAKTLKQKQKAQSQLRAMGHLPVTYVRLSEAQKRKRVISEGVSEGLMRQHWRRGHWRKQGYGAERLDKVIIWIMPTLVGGGSEEEPTDSVREYRVKHS